MIQKILFITPIGWKETIWKKIEQTNSKVEYIVFSKVDVEQFEELKQSHKKIIKNFDGIIVAGSYGGEYIAKLFEEDCEILQKTKAIYMIDTLSTPVCSSRDLGRIDFFKTKKEILEYYLGDQKDDLFLKQLVLSCFFKETEGYYHFLDNKSFDLYNSYKGDVNSLYDKEDKVKYIWTSDLNIKVKNRWIKYIKPEHHLYMLHEPEDIKEALKRSN
jgi:hypothetical protein